NSQPSGPPPITSRRRGNSVSSKTFSLVRKPASTRPGIDGVSGRAPVAIIAFLKRSLAPFSVSASVVLKRASPKNTSTPAARRRSVRRDQSRRAGPDDRQIVPVCRLRIAPFRRMQVFQPFAFVRILRDRCEGGVGLKHAIQSANRTSRYSHPPRKPVRRKP